MSYIWRYLTSPGQSLASYVLRLAPMLMASCIVVQAVVLSPGLITGATSLQWNLKPEALFETQTVVQIALTVAGAAVASLITLALLLALQRRSQNRVLIALSIAALAASVVGAILTSMGATPVASISVAMLFGWVFFVAAIANQVGQLTSNMHGLTASFLMLASTALFSEALGASFTPRATPCEQRHAGERMRCILREEHLRAMQESWEKMDFDTRPPINPEDLKDQQLLSSIGPVTERMLRLGLAECDLQPKEKREACRTAFIKAQKWAPVVMTYRAQKMLKDIRSRDREQRD